MHLTDADLRGFDLRDTDCLASVVSTFRSFFIPRKNVIGSGTFACFLMFLYCLKYVLLY